MILVSLLEGLDNDRYVHVLLNHLPVTGLAVAFLVLVLGPILRSHRTTLLGLALVGVLALSAYPVVYFGEAGYHIARANANEVGDAWLEHHEHLANTWKWLYYATALLAFLSLGLGIWRRRTLWASVPLIALLTAACLAAGAAISDAGGKVAHDEFRFGDPPAHHEGGEPHEHEHE